MEIIMASSAGFCYGVDRAVNMVLEYTKKDKKVYTAGPIIHNSQMVDFLKEKGVFPVERFEDLNKGDIIIVRAHGISPDSVEKMNEMGLEVYDATCPFVKKIHNIVRNDCSNKKIIIIGDKDHAEVIGIRGYCDNNSCVIYTKEEAQNLEIDTNEVAVVAQTTITREKWNEIINIIENKFEKVQKFDTICSATAKRQAEAKTISSQVDIMFVIGSKSSSNTQKLYEVCKEACARTFQIETWEDLRNINFGKIKKVGMTAGASTPEWIIKEVVSKMEEFMNVDVEEDAEKGIEKGTETELDMEKIYGDTMVSIKTGEIVKGKVLGYNTNEVYVDVGYKSDGIIKLEEFLGDVDFDPEKDLEKGKIIEVFVETTNDGEGNVRLSKKKVDDMRGFQELQEAFDDKKILKVKVTEITKGGVIANYKGISLFIPASQVSDRFEKDLEKYKNEFLRVLVTEVNRRKRRYIASSRAIIEEEKAVLLKDFWETVVEGKEYTGTVKSLTDFGAFVDIGGVDGLIHISELSWTKIKHPKDVLKVGETVTVTIKSFDKETSRISLGFRKLSENPWEKAKGKYALGSIVKGKVTRIVPFGAFIELEDNIDALVHISQISNKRLINASDVLSIGQEVEGKVIEIDFDLKKISISIKEVNPIDPPNTEEEKEIKEITEEAPTSHTESFSINIGDMLKDKKSEEE